MRLYPKELENLEVAFNKKFYIDFSSSSFTSGMRVCFFIVENGEIVNITKTFSKFISVITMDLNLEIEGCIHLPKSYTFNDLLNEIEAYFEKKENRIISLHNYSYLNKN